MTWRMPLFLYVIYRSILWSRSKTMGHKSDGHIENKTICLHRIKQYTAADISVNSSKKDMIDANIPVVGVALNTEGIGDPIKNIWINFKIYLSL